MSHTAQPPVEQQSSDHEQRHKYQSPPPPPASITPPPSSSHQVQFQQARTPTPTHSHLSSPPPTVKRPAAGRKRQQALDSDSISRSSDQEIETASAEQLRLMLEAAQNDARSARTSAAHYRLQCELLSMESSEEIKRMGVELEMVRREVDVLQRIRHESPTTSGVASSNSPAQAAIEWQNRCYTLEVENENLKYRLADAKAALLEREYRHSEQIEQLRDRIRENRKHATQLRVSGALTGESLAATYSSQQQEQQQQQLRQHEAYTSTPQTNTGAPFAQLLLAGQVLGQEAASTPATPIGSRLRPHHHHQRNQHSLTSLPSTPYRSTARISQGPYYLDAPHTPATAQSPATVYTHHQHHEIRRRESRDSTISASSEDVRGYSTINKAYSVSEGEEDGDNDNDIDIPTSSASQEAANMLRKSASASFRQSHASRSRASKKAPPATMSTTGIDASADTRIISNSPAATRASKQAKDLIQSKMYGYQITKPGVPGQVESIKRRFYDEGPGAGTGNGSEIERERERERERSGTNAIATGSATRAKKRARGKSQSQSQTQTQGVGLGIGGWR